MTKSSDPRANTPAQPGFTISRRSVLGLGATLAAAGGLPMWGPLAGAPAAADAPPTILSMSDLLSTPPFSFTYDGVSSTGLLASWPKTTSTSTLADGRQRHTVTWTAPDGLQVQWLGDAYPGYTTLAWTVHFTNTGSANSRQLADVLAMDVTVSALPSTDWTVRTARGSHAASDDFTPLDLALPVGSYRVFTTSGGRPTDGSDLALPGSDWQYLTGTAGSGAPGYYNTDQHTTTAAGARAMFTFTGTSVSWIGPKNVDCGIAAVYIDGVQAAVVDMYATTWLKQQTLFSSGPLPDAMHTIEVVNTGRKNPAGSGTHVAIDAFSFHATGAVTVDDSVSGISYSGSWNTSPGGGSPGYYEGTQHSSSAAGASASFTFVGNSVSWIAPKNVDCGIGNVYIDGVQVASVDLYATSWLTQQTVYTSPALTQDTHTIQVVNSGTKNAAGTGTFVPIDAFVYTSSGPTMVDDTSSSIAYSGSWNTSPGGGSPGYFGGTQHSSSAAGDTATFTFSGTGVTWIGPKNIDCGIADVYLDGVKVATVDLYATSWLKQQTLYSAGPFADGAHTLTIVNTGTKNAAGIGILVPIDAFEYVSTGVDTIYNDTDGAISYGPGAANATAIANGWPFWNLDLVGAGLVCALGWPGQWGAEIKRTDATTVRLTGGMTVLDGLGNGQELATLGLTNLWLAAGESIRTPMVVTQPWDGGDAKDALAGWRRWMLGYHVPRAASGTGPAQPLATTQANDYFPGQTDTANDELTWMNAYGTHGATAGTGGIQDHWWIDAGWYQTSTDWTPVGTWSPDSTRFASGLKPVTDRARALGMAAIVWFEPERVMPGTDIATNHPTYLLGAKPGDTQWGGQAYLFDFGNPAALSWASSYFSGLMTTLGVDFYREDFNIRPLPYWQNADPTGRLGLTQAHYVDGHLQFWAALQAAHPGMLIDSCASGGRRLDVLTLQYAINLLRSDDVLDATSNQSHVAALTPWVPIHGGAVRATGSADDAYNLRSGFGPVYHEALAATDPAAPWSTLKAFASEWSSIKQHYVEDFYALTPPSDSDDRFVAWQLGGAASGAVQAFRRPSNGAAHQTVRLRGLTGSSVYRLADLRSGSTWTQSGSSLMSDGLTVQLPAAPLATTITYVTP
ncbi:alpha-galactosidase [Leifsonia shinshuensis]|uniref:alpha-galactosidase n=1 Tax=Leifsonia shinshuensis TaxID=150026 RepID=UPI001F5141F8|nr:alpha-galactosidase [Leifsonia shinshuensis]MCI0158804.1 alpha-galactosidase [Leifsonia shinshuensis]